MGSTRSRRAFFRRKRHRIDSAPLGFVLRHLLLSRVENSGGLSFPASLPNRIP